MGRYQVLGPFRRFRAEDDAIVESAISEMGLEWLADRQIAELSGGQQQRTFLARAVASGADVFLLDEPFAGLDPNSTADLVRRLQAWSKAGRLVVTVVHDIALAQKFFPHVVLIRSHLIAAGPSHEVLSPRNLSKAFGDSYAAERSLIAMPKPTALMDLGSALRDARVSSQKNQNTHE
jgi:ABC-type Mn2+/Zn2+ transport system ATPase subunit